MNLADLLILALLLLAVAGAVKVLRRKKTGCCESCDNPYCDKCRKR